MLRLDNSDNNIPNPNSDEDQTRASDNAVAEAFIHEETTSIDDNVANSEDLLCQVNNNFIPNNDVAAISTDLTTQNAIVKNPNADYRIELVPLSFDISINLKKIKENTIVLKKDKSGLIKGYLVRGGIFKGPYHNLGLSGAETDVLTFPGTGEEPVEIERNAFPELIDKVCMRCGIRSASSLIGTTLAIVYSLGCGVTTVAAFFKMLFAASVTLTPLVFVGAAVIGMSTFVANYRMSQFDLPELFLAGYEYLFKNRYNKDDGKLMLDKNGHVIYEARNISPLRMFLLGFGAVCSFFLGVAFAVLTYTATVNMATAFVFLAPFAAILPIAGVILGGATLISLSLIMFKATSDLLKSDTLESSLYKIYANLSPFEDNEKSLLGAAYRVGVWLFFGAVALLAVGLTFLGSIYTQIACVGSINDTFNITSDLLKGFTATIVGGLAFISQIPFTVKTTLKPILKWFYRWPDEHVAIVIENPQQKQEDSEIDHNDPGAAKGLAWCVDKALAVFGTLASLVNAVANGLIALDGRKIDLNYEGVGTFGAMANSFFSTLGNTISNDIPEPIVDEEQAVNILDGVSSKDILVGLQKNPVNTDNDKRTSLTSTDEDNNSFNGHLSDAPNNVVLFPAQQNGDKKLHNDPMEAQENQTSNVM